MSVKVDEVVKILSGVRYAFPLDEKNFAVADSTELANFAEFLASVINDFRKKAFFMGYKKGVSDAVYDIGKFGTEFPGQGIIFDEKLAEHGAWDCWSEWDKEARL